MQIADAIGVDGVNCLFCDNFPRIRLELQKWAETSDKMRLVSVDLQRIPENAALTDQLLGQLAQAASLLWPDWYENCSALDRPAVFAENADQICRHHPEVNRHWLGAAASACHKGRIPVLSQFSATIQVRQLRLALSDQQLLVAVFLADSEPSAERLLGLSRAVEWLAREAKASVLVVLPAALSRRPELDAINFSAQFWPTEHPEDELSAPSASEEGRSPQPSEERKQLVCPIVGRPHPGSPGEQRLAKQLAIDDELRDLFQFNQRVTTVLDSRFIVDLLWREGRIVVEVDGYGWHSSRSMFNSDRQRDYELTISNYLVLRLPHDFVVQDPALACERIREFVQFRRQHPIAQEMTA